MGRKEAVPFGGQMVTFMICDDLPRYQFMGTAVSSFRERMQEGQAPRWGRIWLLVSKERTSPSCCQALSICMYFPCTMFYKSSLIYLCVKA